MTRVHVGRQHAHVSTCCASADNSAYGNTALPLPFLPCLQIGFAAKGVVYALIGGLACQSAVTGATTTKGADNSPQVCCPVVALGWCPIRTEYEHS